MIGGLIGAVVGLVVACLVLWHQGHEARKQVAKLRGELEGERRLSRSWQTTLGQAKTTHEQERTLLQTRAREATAQAKDALAARDAAAKQLTHTREKLARSQEVAEERSQLIAKLRREIQQLEARAAKAAA